MKEAKLKQIIDHLWVHREYLQLHPRFDYPFYGGLKSKMNGSPESVDAMQNIWHLFTGCEFKSKNEFLGRYVVELIRLGEKITPTNPTPTEMI
jgi:hypothetical protein